jgi:hypothetical protein
MQRGKGTTLTPLGKKLLWAERRSGASVFPQPANIASVLSLEINRALKKAGLEFASTRALGTPSKSYRH